MLLQTTFACHGTRAVVCISSLLCSEGKTRVPKPGTPLRAGPALAQKPALLNDRLAWGRQTSVQRTHARPAALATALAITDVQLGSNALAAPASSYKSSESTLRNTTSPQRLPPLPFKGARGVDVPTL